MKSEVIQKGQLVQEKTRPSITNIQRPRPVRRTYQKLTRNSHPTQNKSTEEEKQPQPSEQPLKSIKENKP